MHLIDFTLGALCRFVKAIGSLEEKRLALGEKYSMKEGDQVFAIPVLF